MLKTLTAGSRFFFSINNNIGIRIQEGSYGNSASNNITNLSCRKHADSIGHNCALHYKWPIEHKHDHQQVRFSRGPGAKRVRCCWYCVVSLHLIEWARGTQSTISMRAPLALGFRVRNVNLRIASGQTSSGGQEAAQLDQTRTSLLREYWWWPNEGTNRLDDFSAHLKTSFNRWFGIWDRQTQRDRHTLTFCLTVRQALNSRGR